MHRLSRRYGVAMAAVLVLTASTAFGASRAPGSGSSVNGAGGAAACSPAWKVVPSPTTGGELWEVSFVAADIAWAVGGRDVAQLLERSGEAATVTPLIERWDGASWSIVTSPRVRGWLADVAGSGPDDAWAVGATGYEARDDQGWPLPRYWALVERWDGAAWTRARLPVRGELSSVSVVSSDDAWAVGGDYTDYLDGDALPVLLHWDGAAWQRVETGPAVRLGPLSDVLALSASDVWVIGEDASGKAVAAHWSGVSWRAYRLPKGGQVSDLAALSSRDVWASGSIGTEFMGLMAPRLWYWNGGKWAVVPAGDDEAEGGLHGIAARPPREVFLTGYDEGYVAHGEETGSWVRSRAGAATARWRSVSLPVGTYVYGLVVDPRGGVWGVGGRSSGGGTVPVVVRYAC
jgi:hypothetical protein